MIRIYGMQKNANRFRWLGEYSTKEWMISVIFLASS
jgi:hypothetical protein